MPNFNFAEAWSDRYKEKSDEIYENARLRQ